MQVDRGDARLLKLKLHGRLQVDVRPGPFPRGVGDDFVPLEDEPEIDDTRQYDEQQRQREGELHQRGAALTPSHVRRSYRSHSTTTAPAVIGKAYGSRGPCPVRSVNSGWGCTPMTRQNINSPQTLLRTLARSPP